MDAFSKSRLVKLLTSFHQKNGRDISASELEKEGFTADQIKKFVRDGLIKKYQVNMNTGAVENRFKLQKDWRSLSR